MPNNRNTNNKIMESTEGWELSKEPDFEKLPHQDSIRPISWLIGKWQSISADLVNPKKFSYKSLIQFAFNGQPLLIYRSRAFHPETNGPMHNESGYLRFNSENNKIALMTSQNVGISTVEEETVNGKQISLISTSIGRMSFAKDPAVTEIKRIFTLKDENTLEYRMELGTSNNTAKDHLIVVFKKI